eukprot:TRINITY_DN57589_c0_g1_i1.p1 TRINITY_DN57589_c0_g1~~TRINITY_DN57589_c0_g1_i1.p1  ORF type:complete len:116 (-),score=15.44 TRINITY_DN57589_c0_g1_i1:31-378(-)
MCIRDRYILKEPQADVIGLNEVTTRFEAAANKHLLQAPGSPHFVTDQAPSQRHYCGIIAYLPVLGSRIRFRGCVRATRPQTIRATDRSALPTCAHEEHKDTTSAARCPELCARAE